ncbi:MAG: hydroxymethylbilane synthase, partial [bacterium]
MQKRLIKMASRASPLAKAQVIEIKNELEIFFPDVEFDITFVETAGDKDMSQSLRHLEKTDFFTKELDELILSKTCCVAIHSAKDLPSPM